MQWKRSRIWIWRYKKKNDHIQFININSLLISLDFIKSHNALKLRRVQSAMHIQKNTELAHLLMSGFKFFLVQRETWFSKELAQNQQKYFLSKAG